MAPNSVLRHDMPQRRWSACECRSSGAVGCILGVCHCLAGGEASLGCLSDEASGNPSCLFKQSHPHQPSSCLEQASDVRCKLTAEDLPVWHLAAGGNSRSPWAGEAPICRSPYRIGICGPKREQLGWKGVPAPRAGFSSALRLQVDKSPPTLRKTFYLQPQITTLRLAVGPYVEFPATKAQQHARFGPFPP
jgi:hypothetical protein